MITRNWKEIRYINVKVCPTLKNVWKTRTDFERLANANKVERSEVAPIVNCEFDDIIYSLHFVNGERSYKMAKKLYEEWVYTPRYYLNEKYYLN